MLNIGITSNYHKSDSRTGIDFAKFREDGFECLDYQGLIYQKSPDYLLSEEEEEPFYTELRNEAWRQGLIFSQMHSFWDPALTEEDYPRIFENTRKCIRAAKWMGSPYVVYHLLSSKGMHMEGEWYAFGTTEELVESNLRLLGRIIPYAEEWGVHIALENLPFTCHPDFFSVQGTLRIARELRSDFVDVCLDTGHLNVYRPESVYDEVMSIGDKLKVLHLHDNDGTNDQHKMPYCGGNLPWDELLHALHDLRYTGALSFENGLPMKGREDLRAAGLHYVVEIGRAWRRMILDGAWD